MSVHAKRDPIFFGQPCRNRSYRLRRIHAAFRGAVESSQKSDWVRGRSSLMNLFRRQQLAGDPQSLRRRMKLLQHGPFVRAMSQMDGSAGIDPQSGFRRKPHPARSAKHCRFVVLTMRLTDRPDHSEVANRGSGCTRTSLINRDLVAPFGGGPRMCQPNDSCTHNSDLTSIHYDFTLDKTMISSVGMRRWNVESVTELSRKALAAGVVPVFF